ncbi:MAG: OmpA family protein [Bacteroidales bacterium]|nr:OmpA family protein [Bacteroidales bacterium]MDZ4204149.1 OmpA family protein [Bacteroidales bacterium]
MIIFSSDMPGGYGGMDIYYCTMKEGRWSAPVNLGANINTTENEVFPYLLNDSVLYFSSNGLPGYGGLDIYRVTRTNDKGWSAPENLRFPVNSSYDDFGILLFSNQGNGLFSSSRPGGLGKDDIYAFRLKKTIGPTGEQIAEDQQVTQVPILSGFVKDKQTLRPIERSKVFVVNTLTNKVKVLETDPTGNYKVPIQKGVLYMVKAMKDGYIQDCLQLRFSETDTTTKLSAPRDLLLDKLEIDKVFVLENIYYDFDKWFIRPDAAIKLNKLVRLMSENPIRVELGSHTDSRGSDEYNIRLSQRRAESAVEYIISQGISPSRLVAKGYGESKLTNQCSNGVPCTPEEQQANRRTEFTVLNFDQQAKDLAKTPKLFNAGDEVDIYWFPPGFFSDCLEIGIQDEQRTIPQTEGQTAASTKQPQPVSAQPTTNNPQPTAAQAATTIGTIASALPCYGVQLIATRRNIDLNDPLWRNAEGLRSYFDGTTYRYVVGCEETMNAAISLRNSLQAKGYKDAFVVKVSDGKVLPGRD